MLARAVPGIAARTSPRVASTSGTLSAKIHRQEAWSTITPPASGPTIAAIPPHAVQAPIAAPRSFGAKAATMIASELGTMSAAAAPCSARAPINTSIVGASAHATEKTPNAVRPIANTRRSP